MGRLIKQINFPADLRKFNKKDLVQISEELRQELIDVVSETGGHLGAGLGVIAGKTKKEKKYFSNLGEEIGLLFQLADDFLDKKGSKHLLGKPVKKDNKKGKSTLLNLMGEKKAYLYANNLKKKILRKLEKHGKKAKELTSTIEFILERKF